MSPILSDGTVLPDEVTYTPRANAVTSIVVNGAVTSTRTPVPGEPAHDANHFDDAFQAVVSAVNGILGSLLSLSGGAKVYNTVTSQFETWPIYITTVDPATTASPPANDRYVWINPTALGQGAIDDGPTEMADVTGLVAALNQRVRSINGMLPDADGNVALAGQSTGAGATVSTLTQAQYDALSIKDPSTLYVVTSA